MLHYVQWGTLSTTSSRTEGTTLNDAFGNPTSVADVGGIPYLYASALDASFVDIDAVRQMNVSIAISEAALINEDGSMNVTACKIGSGLYNDPENPPCARLVITGTIFRPATNSSEEIEAKAALFSRHPSFAKYTNDHNFFVARLSIKALWLIVRF